MPMKTTISIILILLATNASARIQLKAGDILLQPLHCWSCSLIEAQTQSIFSHIAVVIEVKNPDHIYVAESFIKVRKIKLEEYLSKTQKGQNVKVMRPAYVNPNLLKYFTENFEGSSYDSKFLWNNRDNQNNKKELLYCSELIYKLFFAVGMKTPEVYPMKFDVNREYWLKYFKGDVPDNHPGVSPAQFDDEALFEFVGYL